MKISDLEFFRIQVGHNDGPSSLLVMLSTDAGQQGWGEAPLGWRDDELALRRDALLPALWGRSVFDVEELLRLDALDQPPLACAVEMASWDLIGQLTGQPLCHLWGGSYRQHVPLAARLPRQSIEQIQQSARELVEHGYHSQIVSATQDADQDINTISAVLEAVGDRAELCVDAGGCYQMESARRLCSQLPEPGIRFLLDPLPADDLEAHASLARQVNVHLAVGAAVGGPKDVLAVARSGAARHVVLDPHRVGGLLAVRRCAAVAEAAGMSISLASCGSLGLTLAAMLQLAASTPACAAAIHSDYHQLPDDVLASPLEIIDGLAAASQSPGLGVEIDRSKLA